VITKARFLATMTLLSVGLLGGDCVMRISDPTDAMLDGDLVDGSTGRMAEIVPGGPWMKPGPDGRFETTDDLIYPNYTGDADLVLRTGITSLGATFPAPVTPSAAPVGIAEPFGQGVGIPFVVSGSARSPRDAPGPPTNAPSLAGAPVVVAAFADLDRDGFIGITDLDGDPFDNGIEESELDHVGRTVAIVQAGQASGVLRLRAGGPAGNPLTIVLAAAAFAGPLDPAFFGGAVPDGPMVMTEIPFYPRTDPADFINAGPKGPSPPTPGGLLGVQIEPAYEPRFGDPRVGERFTIPVDGSAQTVSLAVGRSGAFTRFGLGMRPDPATHKSAPERPIRPGLDDLDQPMAYEILHALTVADDGAGNPTELRVVPLDRLGNIADIASTFAVTVQTGGTLQIVTPDTDGDPFRETVMVDHARGTSIFVDDGGLAGDDASTDLLVIDDGVAPNAVEVTLTFP